MSGRAASAAEAVAAAAVVAAPAAKAGGWVTLGLIWLVGSTCFKPIQPAQREEEVRRGLLLITRILRYQRQWEQEQQQQK